MRRTTWLSMSNRSYWMSKLGYLTSMMAIRSLKSKKQRQMFNLTFRHPCLVWTISIFRIQRWDSHYKCHHFNSNNINNNSYNNNSRWYNNSCWCSSNSKCSNSNNNSSSNHYKISGDLLRKIIKTTTKSLISSTSSKREAWQTQKCNKSSSKQNSRKMFALRYGDLWIHRAKKCFRKRCSW